jgi:molybdopterin-guanine dinucleotide biosynthesis protein
MIEPEGGIIVGILGQWASGKTAAARTLIRYLGGEGEVASITHDGRWLPIPVLNEAHAEDVEQLLLVKMRPARRTE